MNLLQSKIKDSLGYIMDKTEVKPKIGLILGSGLGMLADQITEARVIPYGDIPHFPLSTVEGHKGQFVLGKLGEKSVICMQGRFHYYEGYSLQEVTYPIRVMQEFGVSELIITNSAGGVNEKFSPGDLMLIEDHINLMGTNPLIGKNEDNFGVRFPDMCQAYSRELRKKAIEAADSLSIKIQSGIYAGLTGPSYETPAEIRYLRTIGADAVGMSTVPEVIVANHGKMKVLGISCISNMAAGILDQPLNHEEVVEVANMVKEKFTKLVKKTVEIL